MVLALVPLPALAGILGGDLKGAAGQLGGDDLLLTLTLTFGKVAVFLVLVLVVGTRVVPWLLSQVARTVGGPAQIGVQSSSVPWANTIWSQKIGTSIGNRLIVRSAFPHFSTLCQR